MTRLYAELARLYFLPDQPCCIGMSGAAGGPAWRPASAPVTALVEQALAGTDEVALALVDADRAVRVLVVDFGRARDWPHVATLYQGLQDDLELPAPALAVRAHAGYALWISLAQPLALADALAFLNALRDRYLAELPPSAVILRPGGERDGADASLLPLLPARHAVSGHWSAFIDPGLGALFSDEPWLEMAPNMDQQAEILAPLKSVEASELAHAREILATPPARSAGEACDAPTASSLAGAVPPAVARRERSRPRSTLALGDGFDDPADFLLALMNDRSASARQRIAAAKALLPYYRSRKA